MLSGLLAETGGTLIGSSAGPLEDSLLVGSVEFLLSGLLAETGGTLIGSSAGPLEDSLLVGSTLCAFDEVSGLGVSGLAELPSNLISEFLAASDAFTNSFVYSGLLINAALAFDKFWKSATAFGFEVFLSG